MKINSVNNRALTPQSLKEVNFKQGLTRVQIDRVRNLGFFDYNNIVDRLNRVYGISANVGQSNTVAFCAETTAKIMRNAGFRLPEYFSFSPLTVEHKGRYTNKDEVLINSNYDDYLDLESQNIFSENLGSGAVCNHFLETYLHEFSHCAHFKNIISLFGADEANKIFWIKLSLLSPKKIIFDPINTLIRKLFPNDKEELAYNIFGNKVRLFDLKDLDEYFAEKNADRLANELGDDCLIGNIDSDFASKYKGFPENFKFDKSEINNPVEYFKKCIDYFDGEIWNGNVDNILNNSCAIRNYVEKFSNK